MDVDVSDVEEDSKRVVRFSSTSGESPEYFPEFTSLPPEPIANAPVITSVLLPIQPIPPHESLFEASRSDIRERSSLILPRSPPSNQNSLLQFFLKFHQEKVISAHYFRSDDYHDLFKRWLPTMAYQSNCLQYAMIAFSALIYSMKVERAAREVAFYHYALALRELRPLLNEHDLEGECYPVIAAVLQLLSIDVRFIW